MSLPTAGSFIRGILKRIGYTLVPAYTVALDVRQMRHMLLLGRLYEKIRSIPGAVVECGVGRGRSLLQFAHLIYTDAEQSRSLWGFDSFAGFPEPVTEDTSNRNPKKGEWSGTSPEDIRQTLHTGGIPSPWTKEHLHLIPGFFSDTLESYDGKPIAFLHIDADLYESYRDTLSYLVPFVAPGGIVLFDEYGHSKWPGATKAVDEFLKHTPWKLVHDTLGDRWYFIKTPQ